MKHSLLISLVILICSCTPQKRLARLLDKHPYLIDQRDTITQRDTVIRPVFRHDTLFLPVPGERDTFIISTPRGVTNVYLNEDKSEARVKQELKADTIIQTRTIIKEMVDTSEETLERWFWKVVLTAAGFLIVYFIAVGLVRKYGK